MDLRHALAGVAELGYRHRAGKDQAAQQHLWSLLREPPDDVPIGLQLRVSGSGQSLPIVPWVALLDPQVTTTAKSGQYLVYLYRADLSALYLSMNQGATAHQAAAIDHGLSGAAAERWAVEEIRRETELIREALSPDEMGVGSEIDLGASRFLPRAYEAGSIAAVAYDPLSLPAEEQLFADLLRFVSVYDTCVRLKAELVADNPTEVRTPVRSRRPDFAWHRESWFRPKNDSEYVAFVQAHAQHRERRHEALLTEFAEHASKRGFTPDNHHHPIDLLLEGAARHILVEAKVVKANAEHAVREAIGQLFAYRHFFYRHEGRADPELLALFTEPVGDALVALLSDLNIGAYWRSPDGWRGTVVL